MPRGDGLTDLRTARELANDAHTALRSGQYGEAMAIAAVGQLFLGLAALAEQVLADSSIIPRGASYERAWRGWQDETGSDLHH
ncbi:hypothetical protein [Planobispora rosea]|uniref:hypothetical protein n=1 Tax=Planobispora rosea TaxID=35762 RepID=UPI00083B733D|nr:hypothetical protein [Planobispora rosea]